MNQQPAITSNELLSTYVRNAFKQAVVYKPVSVDELAALLQKFAQQGTPVSLVGGRNSFGDIFLPSDNVAVDLTVLGANSNLNTATQSVTAGAGVRSVALLQQLTGSQFYLPAQSGSYFNTVGGDIAANVNGKDAFKYGSFYHRVRGFKLLTANGNVVQVDKTQPGLFNATIGGLGLTGIIISAELAVEPVNSDTLICRRISTGNIAETVSAFQNLHASAGFAYAWVDSLATGNRFGRAIIETAAFANHPDAVTGPVNIPDRVFSVNDDWFWFLIRTGRSLTRLMRIDKTTWQTFNALRYNRLKRGEGVATSQPYAAYQYPISNLLPNWYKQFTPRGMHEVQCLFSFKNFEPAFGALVKICFKHGVYPELCAIRSHLPDDAFLSFSGKGLSVTINYDRNGRTDKQLYALERDLIATVIKYGGKVYLAKFPYINKDELTAMYPAFGKFTEIKNQLDPAGIFSSAAWQRWNA